MQFHRKGVNMNEGRQKSCTGNNKIYIIAKVDAHIARHVDLTSELWLAVPTLNNTVETLRQTEEVGSGVVGRLQNHSPYSPHLAPSDFHLSGLPKKHLDGERFATDANMKQAVMSWLETLFPSIAEIQSLVSQLDWCSNVNDDYTDIQCILSATHMSCMDRSQNKVLGKRVFVTVFLKLLLCLWISDVSSH